MKYKKYNTIYNYMMSDWTKTYPAFNEVKLYLTSQDSYQKFIPKNRLYLSEEEWKPYILNFKGIKGLAETEDVMNRNTILRGKIVTDEDPSGDSPDPNTYENVFKEPAVENGAKCPFISSYKGRAKLEARINGEGDITDDEAIRRSFAWKNEFDEKEYRKYSIPLTPLNQAMTCYQGENLVVSAREKFAARGALVATKVDDKLFPIYYIDFENTAYYNQYIFNWNPNGVFRVK